MDNLRNAWTNYVTASVSLIEAKSEVAVLKEIHSEAQEQIDVKYAQAQEASVERDRAKSETTKAVDEFQQNKQDNPDLQGYIANMDQEKQERTPAEIEEEIENLQAQISMGVQTDPRAIREFEQRAKKIDSLQGGLTEMRAEIEGLKTNIERIRPVWEHQLDNLAAKISDAFASSFEKINCLGSVEVGKSTDAVGDQRTDQTEEGGETSDERRHQGYDFENWTIQIRVAFREGEPLSVLDSHRQSGGERAVTTIYYLMALQALSRAPFRVVDEINQGMDPRNERIVHERLVDISCNGGVGPDVRDGGSQYFLVTPKLLPGLKYDSRMKVHVVVSGEFMPQVESTAEAVTFPSLLKRMMQLKGQAGPGTTPARTLARMETQSPSVGSVET